MADICTLMQLAMARSFHHGDVQEGVGGALAQLNEAEALGCVEPLDHGLHVTVGDFVPVEIVIIRHHNGHSKTSKGDPLLRPAAIAMQ